MKFVLKSLRFLFLAVLLLAIALPAAFYIFLSSDWAQERLRTFAQEEFSKLLGTEVTIGHVALTPFNRLHLCEIDVRDDNDSIAAHIKEIDARIETLELITSRRMVIDYAVILGLDGRLYRPTPDAPLNIDGIISHLKSRPKGTGESKIDLTLNNLSVRDSRFSYRVLSATPTPGRFNTSDLQFSDVNITVYAPKITNDTYRLELRDFSAREHSGLTLSNLGFRLEITPKNLQVSDFKIDLPNSHLSIAPLSLPLAEGLKSIPSLLTETPADVEILPESHVFLPDLQALVPVLGKINTSVAISADASVSRENLLLRSLKVKTDNGVVEATVSGEVFHFNRPDDVNFKNVKYNLKTLSSGLSTLLTSAGVQLKANIANILSRAPELRVSGSADGSLAEGTVNANLSSAQGRLELTADYSKPFKDTYNISGRLDTDFSDLGSLLSQKDLTAMAASAVFELTAAKGKIEGSGELTIDRCEWRGHSYNDVYLSADYHDGVLQSSLQSVNSGATFDAAINYSPSSDGSHLFSLDGEIKSFAPNDLALTSAFPGYVLSAYVKAELEMGKNADNPAHEAVRGDVDLTSISFKNAQGDGVEIPSLSLTLDTANPRGGLSIDSEVLKGDINGFLVPSKLVADVAQIVHLCLPELLPERDNEPANSFSFDFTIDKAEPFCKLFKLPVEIVHPVSITGTVDAPASKAAVAVDAPWLLQGDKVIENTLAGVLLNGTLSKSHVYATSLMPTKKGPMNFVADISGVPGNISTDIDWEIQRAIPIKGKIDFDTAFRREDNGKFAVSVDFHPSDITFGQDVWQLSPSKIDYFDKHLAVNNFSLTTPTQKIAISTPLNLDPEKEELRVSLSNINLIEIFETLEINNALISGQATGEVVVTDIFSGRPKIFSPGLTVQDIGYNYCTLGNALVKMDFDNDNAAFLIDADVYNPEGQKSRIYGSITPGTEQLDITFDTEHVKVGFLKPFMSAFASDIKGYASGRAHLFGTFKHIDLEGDVYGDSVQVKIDFTNTWYTASDSIHIRPGTINLKDITITDVDGNRALLNGYVKHTFFSAPVFDFAITQAENFLCYNVPEKLSPTWYGKIYGDGSAHVHGQPGVVDIAVNMDTRPKSVFTFVLSDAEVADEFSFIEFRDATPVQIVDSITEVSTIPQAVLEYRARRNQSQQSTPTAFNLDIQVDVTPEAQVIIVMDPVGGDRIRSNGKGNLRMTYGSVANDLRMYGTYTLERGDYNFTLQDIIIKDFTIQPGSSITFRGDPYAAQLDIQAVYAVNANLSDLDESFLSDKDLNRTKVPVHALMKVTGDMRQPSIDFDLNFPTLTSDTYRKVRSIVSTDEMMNRQIIYLLALNRFYTPDYMASTTSGNELFSVASATLGSQLSNMLGKLSDNWSIAPNLRSERGDFSDIEVDLTLSSTLLNNRLLFNGNLGYRDKALNTNRFVGDFDIEYLLNRRGTWRLKAYNRYNDQNYYLRTALTTQGLGIMYRRDFDKLFNFLRPKRRPSDVTPTTKTATDSIPKPEPQSSTPPDTLPSNDSWLQFR